MRANFIVMTDPRPSNSPRLNQQRRERVENGLRETVNGIECAEQVFSYWFSRIVLEKDMFDKLNEPQREAVRHAEGPLLILAGAGSGKTRVITSRIAYLIAEKGVRPDEIVAVTFTNKAAEEMRERVGGLLSRAGRAGAASDVVISTFHSLGAKLLRWHGHILGLDWNFTILDQDDQLSLVKEVAERIGLDIDHAEAKRLRRFIERMKNRGLEPKSAHEQTRDEEGEKDVRFYEAYQRIARETNCADFGDLLLGVLEIFRREQHLAEDYSYRWRYVMVDEFQDTNPAQYELLRHLSAAHRNLAVVGDDDQSIYRWRDATVANILDFEDDYPDTHVVKLEQNYRSTQLILDAANDVIQNNPERREKRLWTSREGGAPITCFTASTAREEAEYVADEIQTLVRRDATHDDFAVFYRTNAQGRLFEEHFRAAGIPYRVVGGVSFYGREEIKDALAYMQLALNPEDDVSLLRIIGKPTRGVGEKTVEKLRRAAEVSGIDSIFDAVRYASGRRERLGVGLPRIDADPRSPSDDEALEAVDSLRGRPKGGLADFADLVADLRERMVEEESLADLVEHLLSRINYFDWLESRHEEKAEDKKRNLVELIEAIRDFEREEIETDDLVAPVADQATPSDDMVAESAVGQQLRKFLERSSLVRDAGEEVESGVATLMTIHGAKGLEFDTVFLVGMEEQLFPNLRGGEEPEELFEERRLAYVAITRAEEKLYVTNAKRRRIYGQTVRTEPSRFLLEVDDDRIEIDRRSSADKVEYRKKRSSWRQRGRPSTYRSQGDSERWSFDQSPEDQIAELSGAVAEAADAREDYFSQLGDWERGESGKRENDDATDVGKNGDRELVGATVTHSRFGIGRVTAVSGDGDDAKLTIDFPGEGEQTIVRKFVQVLG